MVTAGKRTRCVAAAHRLCCLSQQVHQSDPRSPSLRCTCERARPSRWKRRHLLHRPRRPSSWPPLLAAGRTAQRYAMASQRHHRCPCHCSVARARGHLDRPLRPLWSSRFSRLTTTAAPARRSSRAATCPSQPCAQRRPPPCPPISRSLSTVASPPHSLSLSKTVSVCLLLPPFLCQHRCCTPRDSKPSWDRPELTINQTNTRTGGKNAGSKSGRT